MLGLTLWALFGVMIGIIGYALDADAKPQQLVAWIFAGIGGAIAGGLLATTLFGGGIDGLTFQSIMIAALVAVGLVSFGVFRHIRQLQRE